jgi:hypothetical protein
MLGSIARRSVVLSSRRSATKTRDVGSRTVRRRPFGIAADRQGLPFLVRAPHRRLRCMGNLFCTGLIL